MQNAMKMLQNPMVMQQVMHMATHPLQASAYS